MQRGKYIKQSMYVRLLVACTLRNYMICGHIRSGIGRNYQDRYVNGDPRPSQDWVLPFWIGIITNSYDIMNMPTFGKLINQRTNFLGHVRLQTLSS